MDRLLRKAEELEGYYEGALSTDSFADVAEAIHIIQENLGIAGTTAKEASSTISGSAASMKSAWQNLVVGFADDSADLDGLLTNIFDSVLTFGDNIIPRIESTLKGISNAIAKAVPVIVEKLPEMVNNILPSAIEAVKSLINGIITVLPNILQMLMQVVIEVAPQLLNEIISILPQLIETGFQLVIGLINGITEALPELITTITDVALAIVDTLTEPENLMALIGAGLTLLVALADGIMKALPRLVERMPEIIENICVGLLGSVSMLLSTAAQLVMSIVTGIINTLPKAMEAGVEIVKKVADGFSSKVAEAKNWGKDLIQNFIDGVLAKWNALKQTVSDVANTVKDFLGFSEPKKGPLSNFHTYAPDMIALFVKGIKDNQNLIRDAFNGALDFGISNVPAMTQNVSSGVTPQNNINITVNVNGDAFDNGKDLAEYIAGEIQRMTERRALVFG